MFEGKVRAPAACGGAPGTEGCDTFIADWKGNLEGTSVCFSAGGASSRAFYHVLSSTLQNVCRDNCIFPPVLQRLLRSTIRMSLRSNLVLMDSWACMIKGLSK